MMKPTTTQPQPQAPDHRKVGRLSVVSRISEFMPLIRQLHEPPQRAAA